ncbi:MAG: hypothetical protein RI958_1560, partial [Actinomycetota bacterium]
MEWIFLVLIAVVLLFGIGVVVVNRRRSAIELEPDRTSEIVRPPRPLVEPQVSAPPAPPEVPRGDETTTAVDASLDDERLGDAATVEEVLDRPVAVEERF